MTELVAQHHVSDANALGAAEQCRGQGPGFHRGIVGRARTVEVVVEPQRVDAELLAAQRAMQDLVVGEAHLGQIDADLGLAHGRSSNLPWVMVVVPLTAASNANEFSLMPKAFTVSSESNGVGDANRTAIRRTLAGSLDAQQAEQAVCADRHRAQPVGEHEVETRRARHLDVEVVRRPVAGHLRVAVGDVLVDVLADGPERAGTRVFGEPMVGGHRPQIRDTRADRAAPSSTTVRRRPPRRRRPARTAPRSACLPEIVRTAESHDRRIKTFTGIERSVQHDVVFAVHPAADMLPHRLQAHRPWQPPAG